MRRMSTVRAFLRLSGYERVLAIKIAFGLIATWAGLRVFGYPSWKSFIDKSAGKKVVEPQMPVAKAQQIARLVTSTAQRLLPKTNCLEQSLVILFLLRKRGAPTNLRFGGRKDEGRFEAHAWVEWEGVVLNEDSAIHHHFIPFEPLSESKLDLEKFND